MLKIPSQPGQMLQVGNSNVEGILWASFNLDLLTNRGRIRGASRLLNTNNNVVQGSNFGLPVGFRSFLITSYGGSPQVWMIAGNYLWYILNGLPSGTASQDSISNSPTLTNNIADIEVFNNYLFVSGAQDTNLYYLKPNATWNTVSGANPASALPCPLCPYGARLYYAGSTAMSIYSIDNSATPNAATSGQYTLQLPQTPGYQIAWLRAGTNRIWIGIINTLGGKGCIYEWDGASNVPTKQYKLDSTGALACIIKDDIPYVVDSYGRFLYFDGSTFRELARLPLADQYLINATATTNSRFIHPNGMSVINGKINILINNALANGGVNDRCPSGVWEYCSPQFSYVQNPLQTDDLIGLYHKRSFTYALFGNVAISDYGQERIIQAGALSELRVYGSTTAQLIAGAQINANNPSGIQYGLWCDDFADTAQKYSYFITQQIMAQSVIDTFKKVWVRFRKFLTATDKIIVKYRTRDFSPVEVGITWLNTTQFTTTGAISAFLIGDEVEVTQGTGAGYCAHITKIDHTVVGNTTTYTITLDDAFIGVTTGTALARFSKWVKIKNEITDQNVQYKDLMIGVPDSVIQLKVCMRFTGKNEIYDTLLDSEPHINQ